MKICVKCDVVYGGFTWEVYCSRCGQPLYDVCQTYIPEVQSSLERIKIKNQTEMNYE